MTPFAQTLAANNIVLARNTTTNLQINTGLVCNQTCKHCHLDAGPHRKEAMDRQTAEQVANYVRRCGYKTIDLTGGAPELNPQVGSLISRLAKTADRVMFRANLTLLTDHDRRDLLHLLKDHRVVIVASFPTLNDEQMASQRGKGVFERSLKSLEKLNEMGYGRGNGLEINLISNPTGAFLPADQGQTEKHFRSKLDRRYGLSFDNLYCFANMPLGRFKDWLVRKNLYDSYMAKLISAFNSLATEGVMCGSQVSVDWNGYLFDCDFNIAAGLPLNGRPVHVTEMDSPPPVGNLIAVSDHCYTCTAGAGFT